ncbi:ATP-binding protein [Pararhodobacter zhoushanensis]|uniref:histidine kinase n=1 Tax=Pararhodobacter zhoushanensis TaxID=2479545 RepID=A0ABT3H1R9_9RHOB|nr:ATP-binding protein [Pararhodobacter zhoushanensis]MCW1933770.1 ATP-binding protein [Pararhodobacter zhoushanensis]
MQRFLRVTNIPAAISLAVVVLIWTFAELQNRHVYQESLRHEVLGSASVVRAQIEGTLSSNIQLVRGLIATLITEPDMSAERFAALSTGLMSQNSLLRNLAAAPDMVIRYVYPLEGNAAALGLSYLDTPEQREGAILARDSGGLVVAGPVALVQGGSGFIGRFPVFIPDGTEQGQFWGLVSAVIDADRFYAEVGLNDDTLSIELALSGHVGQGSQDAVFFGDAAILENDPVQVLVNLPFGTWEISAIPRGGWRDTPSNAWGLRLWLLLGAMLIVIPSLIMGRLLDERASNVKRLHVALRRRGEAHSRYQSVSRVSRTFVWEQDAERGLTYLSSSYQHITGQHRQSLLGHGLQDLAKNSPHFEPRPDWAALAARMSAEEDFSDFVCLAATADGSEVWLQLSGSPVFDEAGVLRGYRGAGMDITTAQRARQAADDSSRAKSIFLANMSHEIRTPLNGVLGMAQVLESLVTDPDQRAMVTTIRESGQSLHNILNDILDLSKIEADKLELENNPFQPESTLQRIVNLHQLGAEEKGLQLTTHGLTRQGPARRGDTHRFAQILHNLIGNAVKFTESGQVSVDMSNRPGEALTVQITDTGPGMTDEALNRLFDAFVQGDGSVARRHGGTGLGMSIVQRLIQLMQGEIDVQSSPGKGTTILITLPLPEHDMVRKAEIESGVVLNLSGLRLLTADDNATNRRVLEAMLRGTGIVLTLVEDGQQAIDAWRASDFDVLMLDISMPVVGGIAALNQIAQEAALTGRPMPPAIAFTANVMAHQITEYLNEGFVSCVGKPLNRALLLDALKMASQHQNTPPTP